ncbi:chemotaxis protein CheW [Methylobacter tundripaludum]|uniref:chemotaxis protein CheW n=1 Tax=Methylobacter tundripaludum TaxID=173365 RepID=UPI0004DFC27A|nr:chemotaxis protein CheW [Methylobacter tundripaludum]
MSDELDINEVWGLYAEEGGCSLDEVEECLLILSALLKTGSQDEPSNTEAVARLFRAMHTYKGNARMLGLSVIESVAHLAEDMIGLVRDEGVALDGEIVDLLLEATDILRGMLETSVSTHQDAPSAMAGDLNVRMKEKFTAVRDVMTAGGTTPRIKEVEQLPRATQGAVADDCMDAGGRATQGAVAEAPQSIVFEPLDTASLANDPVYREIFFGMAHDVLHEMRSVLKGDSSGALNVVIEEAERLCHAAEQIGMLEWLLVLQDFLGIVGATRGQAEALLSRLQALYEQNFATQKPNLSSEAIASDDPVRRFFDALEQPLGRLSQLGNHLSADKELSLEAIVAAAGEVRELAEAHGFVRVMDVLDRVIADARTGIESLNAHFARLEFLLYEELASVAEVMLEDRFGLSADPRTTLRAWCANHVFESLLDMRNVIERIKRQEDVRLQCTRMIELMRQVYHACLFYGMETAAHLSMSIVDLFARAEIGETAPDVVLLHIAKSFIGDIEIILDVAELGETPDMAQIEKLLQEASEATFAANGTVSSSQIEARLGLPKAFHKVLTPENVQTALSGLEDGHHFYIVRSDLNNDEELAANFLSWMSSGAAQVISNVTVFEGNRSLFDFLVSSPLDEVGFNEALIVLDPKGECLHVEVALVDRKAGDHASDKGGGEQAVISAEEDVTRAMAMQGTMSGDMLESIGELVTGQAMVHHLLTRLFESDLVRTVESKMAGAGDNWHAARGGVRETLENWLESVEKLIQLESQNTALLNRLQEEALAVRVRPAALLLKPLAPFVSGLARQHARQVSLVTVGDDIELDFSMIDSLKSSLRTLVTFCVSQSIEIPERRIGAGKDGRGTCRMLLVKHEDHVAITVEDDGQGIDLQWVMQRSRQLGWTGERPDVALALRDGFGEVSSGDGDDGRDAEGRATHRAVAGGVDLATTRSQLRHLGGDLRVSNLPSGGTRFFLTMPLAMVVLEGMAVRVGEVQYVVPIDAIQRIVRSGADELMQVSADRGRYMLRLEADDVLPIQFLSRNGQAEGGAGASRLTALEQDSGSNDDELKHLFVVVGKNGQRTALAVDELIGQQQVLIRPLHGYLSGIRGVTGCALLGSGDVGMVLDMSYVLSKEMGVE